MLKQPTSLFVKLFFSITIFLVCSILISFFTLYRYFEKQQLNTAIDASGKILGQMSYSADYMNDSVRNFSFSIFNNPDIIPLMYQDRTPDVMGLFSQIRKLYGMIEMNPFVHSLYIYNNKLDSWFTVGNNSYSNSYKSMEFPDKEITKLVANPHPDKTAFKPTLRMLPAENSNTSTEVFTYILYDFSAKEGALIVNIKSTYLQNMVEKLNAESSVFGGRVLLVDRDGNVIGNESNLSDNNPAYLANMLKKIGDTAKSGNFFEPESREMIFFVTSDVLGWKYIRIVPYGAIIAPIEKMKTFTILLSTCLLGSALFASFLLARRIYRPFSRLVEKVMKQTGPEALRQMKGDEVSVLSQAFQQSHVKASMFEQEERHKSIENKNELLKTLLSKDAPIPENTEFLLQNAQVQFRTDQGFIVLLLKLDRFLEFKRSFSTKDRELLVYGLVNAAHEVIGEKFANETFKMDEDKIVVILNVEDDNNQMLKRLLGEFADAIRTWSEKHLRLSFTFSYGYIYDDYRRLKDSYEEVLNIAKYRLIFGTASLITPETIQHQRFEKYSFPPLTEKRFMEAIVSGNVDEAENCFAKYAAEIATYSYDSLMSSIFYLNHSIYSMVNSMENNGFYQSNFDFIDFFEKIGQQETLSGISHLYSQLFAQIAAVLKESRNKWPSRLVETIKKLVESNYKDKSLCLESIAGTMNMSKIYLGKVFREACGQSVSDYLMNVRIHKAVELLHEGVKPMNEIIEEIGIENKNYFYKLFKARLGTPFSEYKLKLLNEKSGGNSH